MSTIEIFKTDVQTDNEAQTILDSMLKLYTCFTINFDLEDRENILRIHSIHLEIETHSIVNHLNTLGYNCELIE